jgi:hypothetical protein
VNVSNWLEFDPREMQARVDREPFVIRHRLAAHPLLQLPRIIELSRSLPVQQQEYNSGDVAVNQDYLNTPRTKLSAEETLVQIEQCRSWMVLKNVERDVAYGMLLDECLKQLADHTEAVIPGMCYPEAFIFVSSPHSITPYHMDPEHNFLLQVRGSKRMTVFDRNDRSVVSELQLEKFYSGAHRNIEFRDDFAAKGKAFELTPGLGLHVPVTAPHWVANGDMVSISFSITFRSKSSYALANVYSFNSFLRSKGFNPRSPGLSPLRDRVKRAAVRVTRKFVSVCASLRSTRPCPLR